MENEQPQGQYKGFRLVKVDRKGWRSWYRSYTKDNKLAQDNFPNLESLKACIDNQRQI